jgi:uncharacterized protein (UPF0147 family)
MAEFIRRICAIDWLLLAERFYDGHATCMPGPVACRLHPIYSQLMHTHPEALAHLMTIRESVANASDIDPEVRRIAAELIDRLELLYNRKSLSRATVVIALDAFKGIPGTAESVDALRIIATEKD